ncbi:MAG: hypothetical protein ACLGSD_19485 [Acidobacteriota bacterium]
MNGLSIIFAVVVILTVAVLSGLLILLFIGGARLVAQPPWKRHKSKLPPIAHHHS